MDDALRCLALAAEAQAAADAAQAAGLGPGECERLRSFALGFKDRAECMKADDDAAAGPVRLHGEEGLRMLTNEQRERDALAWLERVQFARLERVRLAGASETARAMASELRGCASMASLGAERLHEVRLRIERMKLRAERFKTRADAEGALIAEARAALRRMPNASYSALLAAYYVEGKTWEQAAADASYSVSYAIRTVRHRALAAAWDVMPEGFRVR